jgi:branched-chain amino acid transport system substrate-binding protein
MKSASASFTAGIALATIVVGGALQVRAQQASGEPIPVGLIANLTGTDVASSLNMTRGVEMAVEEVNAGGGIDGRPLNLITEDSEYRSQEALNAATKLYEIDGVEAAIMFGGSSLMIPVAELAQQKGKILVNTSSSSPKLGEFPGTLFSVLPLDDIMGEELGTWVAAQGAKTAAFVVPNNTFGTGLMEAAAEAFESQGGQVVRKVAYTEGQPDYRADVQALVQANPDAIIAAGYGDDSRAVFKNARQLGLEAPWYAAYPSIFSVEDEAWMSGRLLGIDNAGSSLPSAQAVRDAYAAKYGEQPSPHVYYGYDAAMILARAMQDGGTEAEAIGAALPKVIADYEGATGKIRWDDHGQRIDPPVEFVKYQDGQFELLEARN